ncbi:anther-specific proline-rich protein APG-like [Drosophila serrata]|uniref:anther-specific proline-rich protein APG-like n=1 Tax=Drosophila serrata TaxID=7274 RepID=UPI000A1D1E17|nr:anther-specific proline-rich protein APG-like [Drosophila serrata]XP_020812064.1 anther-specific proline-rich protein APG-like [Drosophila serrata]
MPLHLSPSWPAFGHVQKLTDLFEEKALPKKSPKILKKPVPMPKLKPELLVRIKVALGEEPQKPPKAPKPQKPHKPHKAPAPKPNTSPLQEAQPGDNAASIGDGGDNVVQSQCPRNGGDNARLAEWTEKYRDYHFVP